VGLRGRAMGSFGKLQASQKRVDESCWSSSILSFFQDHLKALFFKTTLCEKCRPTMGRHFLIHRPPIFSTYSQNNCFSDSDK
jgi:hypothetical protein